MPIDASIYQNFLRAPKSMQDYDNEAMQAQGNALQLQTQRMQANALMQDQSQEAGMRNFLASNPNLKTPEGQAGLYRFGTKRAFGVLENQAKIGQANEAAAKDRQQSVGEAIKNSRMLLDGVTTPQQYLAWHQANHADPVLGAYLDSRGVTVDQAMAKINEAVKTPQGFAQLLNESKLGAEKAYANAMAQKDFDLKAQNELIGPDGKPNTTLIGVKTGLAKAGAASTNVNVTTGQKGFDNELKLRGDFKQEPVYKAHQEMQSAHSQIQQSLKQATPAGDLAGATKIMKLLDPGSVVRESELGMAMAATGLLDRVQNYAQNIISGNKLTPKQRIEFQQLADALYGESINHYNSKRGEYIKLGSEYGLDAGRAIGAPASMAAKPSKAPGGVIDFGSLK
jgi:hypothetical protein